MSKEFANTFDAASVWLRRTWDHHYEKDWAKLIVDASDWANYPREPIFVAQEAENDYRRGFLHGFTEAVELAARLYRRGGFVRVSEIENILNNFAYAALLPWKLRSRRDVATGDYSLCCTTPRFSHKSWIEIRRQVFQRDEMCCTECGSRDQLEAHHIIPVADGGTPELDNLQTLCKRCHRGVA